MKKSKISPLLIITTLIVIFYITRAIIRISQTDNFPYAVPITISLFFFVVLIAWLLIMTVIRNRIIRDIEEKLRLK